MWLCGLPVRLRHGSLTALLDRGGRSCTRTRITGAELEHVVREVQRVCRMRVFAGRWHPRLCLREALALYAVLRGMGCPARFHLGVYKRHGKLLAHSWVTVRGRTVVPFAGEDRIRTIYTHPA